MKYKILKFLNQFYIYRYLAYRIHKYDVNKNYKKEADRYYYPFFKKKINWENPKDLIEKINWLQFNSDTSLWTKCADKYLVRNYVKECGFEDALPILYGKWDNAKDIDFDKLPNSFVLKTNNGCGTNFIVKDKSELNIKSTVKKLNQWLSIPYGYAAAQVHYTRIKPCIIAEELLVQGKDDTIISPNSLIDYKIYCINGVPEIVYISYDRTPDNSVFITAYDLNWEECPHIMVSSHDHIYSDREIPKPLCFQEMLDIASKLSRPFIQVRVDFFVINDKPIIGELTFSTGFGFFTHDYYDYLGSKIDLSKVNKLEKL